MGLREGLFGVARTAGVPLTGVALTLTSPMTSADLTTSTPTSALATAYVNLRGEEDLCHRKRNGGEGALGLRFLLITGNSAREMAGVLPEALQGHGKAADLERSASLGNPRTHVFEGAEKKASEEEHPQDMRVVPRPEEGMVFLVLKTLVQRRILMLLMRQPEHEISEAEVEVPHEEEGKVYFPPLTSSLALKEDGSQIPGMETESQDQVMNIFVMLPALIIPLMTVIPQPAESALLLYKAWTWHPCHPESVPGMMGQALLSTERWRPQGALLRTEEAKAEEARDLLRECQNLGVPALWMETTMMDTIETNLLGVLQAVAPLLEGAGVAVTGVEGAT